MFQESNIVDDLWVDEDYDGSVVLNPDTELDSDRSNDQLSIDTENSEGSRQEQETERRFAHAALMKNGPSAELTKLKSFENYAFDEYDSQTGTKTIDNNTSYELPSTSHSSAYVFQSDFTDLKTISNMSDTSVTVEYSEETFV